MKDHEKRELINALTGVAVKYAGTQQLREQISHLVLSVLGGALADGLDAERWRAFLRLSEKSICPDKGCITFYLRRPIRGLESLLDAIDSEIARKEGQV